MSQEIEALEAFQNLLISIATGAKNVEVEYRKLRIDVNSLSGVNELLPSFARTCRNSDQFWQFIKSKFSTYQERRDYIAKEFSQAFNYLESLSKNIVDVTVSASVNAVTHKYIDAEWKKALIRNKTDPEGAITTARTLVETTCKYILDSSKIEFDDGMELPRLYKLVAQSLNLAPDQHTEQIFRQILGGASQ